MIEHLRRLAVVLGQSLAILVILTGTYAVLHLVVYGHLPPWD